MQCDAVWDNVYGFNMSCIKKQAMTEPLVASCLCWYPQSTICDESLRYFG